MPITDPTKMSYSNGNLVCHAKSSNLDFVREMCNFEDLQMASIALRKALNDMKQSNEQRRDKRADNANNINIDELNARANNNNEKDFVCLTYSSTNVVRFVDGCSLNNYSSTSSTSSDHLVESNQEVQSIKSDQHNDINNTHSNQFCLAFDNLTYFSSIESDLPHRTSQSVEFNLTKREELGLESSENESDQDDDDDDEFNMEMKQGLPNGQAQTNPSESALKKTLKSIKRKDKLKKSSGCTFVASNGHNEVLTDDEEMLFDKNKIQFQLTIVNKPSSSSSSSSNGLTKTKSMPDLTQLQSDTFKPLLLLNDQRGQGDQQQSRNEREQGQEGVMISNSEYEKQLKKLLRNKSFSRSLRRAKTVYYRNRRSKSIEDLSVEERNTYLARINSNLNLNLLKHKRTHSAASIDSSCSSSGTSNGLASDISSSYFHELSDWSPEFNSSNSESSQEELFHNVDWDAKFSSIVFVSPLLLSLFLSLSFSRRISFLFLINLNKERI